MQCEIIPTRSCMYMYEHENFQICSVASNSQN